MTFIVSLKIYPLDGIFILLVNNFRLFFVITLTFAQFSDGRFIWHVKNMRETGILEELRLENNYQRHVRLKIGKKLSGIRIHEVIAKLLFCRNSEDRIQRLTAVAAVLSI